MESKNIQVAIRIRPKLQGEQFLPDFGSFDSRTVEVAHRGKKLKNSYSRIFGPLTDQQEIYEFIAPTLNKVDQGYSSAIFAYGLTGSGKTFTMFGPDSNPGLIYQSVSHIINNLGESFKVSFSVIQIYQEKIYDMLQDPYMHDHPPLREDPLFGVYVKGIIEYVVQTPEDIIELLRRGNSNRCFRNDILSYETNHSHCVFQLNVESKTPNADGNIIRAKVHLIDLAGSELIKMTNLANYKQHKDLKDINKSLRYLGKIINCLYSNRGKFISYAESKLTFLLKDSFQCNTGIVFIATISPTVNTIKQTLLTLVFAKTARQVTLNEKPTEFSVADSKLAERLEREIRYVKDNMKIPKNKDSIQLKPMSLQRENGKMNLPLDLGMEKVLEENRLMKENLRNLAKTQELDELDQLYEKFPSIQVASSTTLFRQTTPNKRTIDNRIFDLRNKKNPYNFAKRTASLHKTLEQFDKEKYEISGQGNKVKRLKTLKQIQAYRENKVNKASEKFQKTLAMQDSLLKKYEACKTQQFSEVTIKTFRDMYFANKATAKAEAEKEKAIINFKRVENRKVSRSPRRNTASLQILSKNAN